MKPWRYLRMIVLGLTLGLLPVLGGSADNRPGVRPLATFSQTTTDDWSLGTAQNVDRRNLDALHTPYNWGDDARGSVRLASRPGSWTRQSVSAPAVPKGSAGEWDAENVAEAAVLHDGSQYLMWYSGINAASQWQMGLATSSDGLYWGKYENNPVLAVGSPGSWDSQEASFSGVLFNGSTFYTWYSGYDGSQRQIGYAFSVDGINWLRSSNPVLSGTPGDWDENLVGNPTVLHDGSEYHMWYGGWSGADGHWHIGHATSPEGITWTKDLANPVLDLGPADAWDDTHVTAPTVLFDGHSFHMWYAGWGDQDYGEYSPGQVGQATSLDGTVWTKDAANPVYGPNPGSWDAMWTVDPEVIFDGELYRLWYTGGFTSTGLQIGYATAVPVYESSGTYTSPLVNTACPTESIPLWSSLQVYQVTHDQSLVYAILDEAGQPIPPFDALWSSDAVANFDLSTLSWLYEEVYVRASFSTGDTSKSPVLEEWVLTWSCHEMPYHFYLPALVK